MSGKSSSPRALQSDPLSVDDILATGFYRPERDSEDEAIHELPVGKLPEKKPRPTHYKVVCISLYNEDIERLEGLVKELKRRGYSKANKSLVIRAALEQLDVEKVPRFH
jgi:hypothetical protein